MALEWLTYGDAAERLGISPEAVRQRSIRHEWTKRTGNDGRAEIRIDVEELKASSPPRRQSNGSDEQPSDPRPTPEQPSVGHASDARTFEALDAHIETLKAMVARAGEDVGRERERADALATEVSRLQVASAVREANHTAQVTALSQRFADEVSESRNAATAQRERTDVALAEAQRMQAEVKGAEQACKQQVRAEHDRWKALPWVLRKLVPEPPYIDMFGHIAVRTPNGVKLVA